MPARREAVSAHQGPLAIGMHIVALPLRVRQGFPVTDRIMAGAASATGS